jgi:hypothetical protein
MAACRGGTSAPDGLAAAPVPEPSASQPAPTDHLAADELVEGEKKAFGVPLPRDVRVDGAFVDVVMASGPMGVRPLVKYFRARLTEGSLHAGDEAATFDHVHVPGNPGAEYSLHIWVSGMATRLAFRDTTPKPQPNLPDDTARWRQAGLTPQGAVLDPTHLE